MSNLTDQLKALGLEPGRRTNSSGKQPKRHAQGRSKSVGDEPPSTKDGLLLTLPRFGTVARLEEERGFGFISAGGHEDVFFHFRGFPGKLPEGQKLPPVGSRVVFITGSDPRRPNEPKKGVVLWAPVEAVIEPGGVSPTDQASLDAIRREALAEQSPEVLWALLEAAWYAKSWRGDAPAPADLEDAVLEQATGSLLAGFSPTELEARRVAWRLAKSRYRFAARLSPDNPACAFTRLLELFEPPQLAVLGAPDVTWVTKGKLAPTSRSRILEWHLISRSLSAPKGDWEQSFPGTDAEEFELATRVLDYSLVVDPFTAAWLERIARNGLVSEAQAASWLDRRPELAIALFPRLPAIGQEALLSSWRKDPTALDDALGQEPDRAIRLLAMSTLAFDLETDGERIWEIGCARNGQASLLHDERGGTDPNVAMAELARRIRAAPILVGHNILAWDWPIASRQIHSEPAPLIWDTLLVQYLLEPQARSHALGGSHRADGDALTALQLFEQQLQRLPPSVARGVLAGAFATIEELLDAIAEGLQGVVTYAHALPQDLAVEDDVRGKLVVVPEARLRDVDWVPGVTVVAADAAIGLLPPWRQINVEAFAYSICQGTGFGPNARVLLSVASLASRQGIALRRNMLPTWLIDGDSRLSAAVDGATIAPTPTDGLRIASIPTNVEWWRKTDRATYTLVGLRDNVLVVDRRQLAPSEIGSGSDALPAASFMRFGDVGSAPLWLMADRAAHVLDRKGGMTAFRTLSIGATPPTTGNESFVLSNMPQLATRRHHVLHPGAEDQAGYWTEVLRTFQEIAEPGEGKVPILLVGSSRNRELIDVLGTGLAELGMGEVKPDHRSQREHLRRASSSGFSLVSGIDQWPEWNALAKSAGIVLQPVVEALPVEEWYACDEERSTSRAGDDAGGSRPDSGAVAEVVAVDAAVMLEKMPALVEATLHRWLRDLGLSEPQCPVVLIDSRAGTMGSRLARIVEPVQLKETPLSTEAIQRLDIVLAPLRVEREEAPSGYEAMEQFLVANWQPANGKGSHQVTGFKPSQRTAMEAISARAANVLVSLPTGEGKSVLFQVPALCRGLRNRRLTLVLSPLKALMRDQVERLREQGFSESADYLSGDRPPHEIADVMQGILDHRIVLLYVAPERLRSEVFLDVLEKRMRSDGGLEHVVVDETHCVNQWGYEFRPDYFHALQLLLGRCREADTQDPTPFILLSATITASDRARLQAILTGDSGGPGHALPLLVRPDAFANPLRSHIAVRPERVRGHLHDRREFDKALAERLPYIQQAIADARRNRELTGQRSAVLVFASSRAHTEIVAQSLASEVGGQVDYYHAGLDSASREEIYTRFLDGELDVLVATKAFGMGMDIPDIHWVVHLSPPGYLEDFLQEVGRIGRGAKERENAQLDKLSALLLCSDRDFEAIRGMRARSALSLPIIKELYQQAERHAYELDGQRVAIVPSEGFVTPENPPPATAAAARAKATRVRMGLYWLERAGRVRLCGSIADLMVVTIHHATLLRLAREEGVVGEVAKAILEVEQADSLTGGIFSSQFTADLAVPSFSKGRASTSGGGLFGGVIDGVGRLLGGLADMVGLLFGAPRAVRPSNVPGPAPARTVRRLPLSVPEAPMASEHKIVVLNLSQLKLRSTGLKSIGDVLACLADLEKLGGVSLKRDIQIVPRKLASDPEVLTRALFDYVDTAVTELLRRLELKGRIQFNPFEMVEDVEGPNVNDEQKRRQYERAFINAFRWLARASGARLRQITREDGKVIWEAVLASSACGKANARRERIRKGAQSLFDAVAGQTSIPLAKLIDSLRSKSRDGRFRESDLGKAAGLLAAMNLVSISPELVPLSHVVMLPEVDSQLEAQTDTWEELNRVNDLSEARNMAMEVFANIGEDAREAFIEGYFGTSDAEGLRQFLDTQLGEIEIEDGNEGVSSVISEMREKVRATKAVEFFERFEQSEEPVQWDVARSPFDRHVLVNAGPGAGKTFVLVGRIAHLIRMQSIDPAQIVVLAFNRAVVFEIRRRIRELFKSLGYAAYASRLRVSTFHSFAIKNLARHGGVELSRSDMDGVLKVFSDRMERDAVFRTAVAGGVRSILVDEFQDVTDQVYAVVRNLYLGSDSRAGVMVIGDDDQDILRWQRKNDGSSDQFSEAYFDRFARDFAGDTLREFTLGRNFRSGRVIVERSQSTISGLLDRSKRTRRLKVARLVPREGAIEGEWARFDWRNKAWLDAVEKARDVLRGLEERPQESVAVLCRTNAEVASAHRLLSQTSPHLAVQGGATLRVADLRNVGMWLDLLRVEAQEDDRALSESAKQELIARFVSSTSLPEIGLPETAEVGLAELWDLCCQEQAFPHLSTLIRFVGELRSDDLARLSCSKDSRQFAIVSTLHKVKGLEFDNVVILPSTSSYGGKDKAGDAAEEARLLYVGMTRAKRHLTYFVGDREYCWGVADPIEFDGVTTDGRVLIGAMDDVALGWAMQQGPFNPDAAECQRYIESEVAVGDPITLGGIGGGAGKAFLHKSASGRTVQVGFLAKKHGSGVRDASLRVSAVVRFRPDTFDDSVPDFVRARGWGYVVLVSGRLR